MSLDYYIVSKSAHTDTTGGRPSQCKLVITDPTLFSRRIGGMFPFDDVEAFVRLIERNGVIRAERQGNTLLLRAP